MDAMTGTLNKEQAETLCQELNDVEAKALVNTLLDIGEDVEAETLGNQQCNVHFRGSDPQGELLSLTTYQ